jgi:hypothetical protein
MLRQASELTKLAKIVGIILVNILLGVILSVGTLALVVFQKFRHYHMPMQHLAFRMAILNLIDVLACLVFVVLMILVLVHRAIWPLIERPLYACARYGVIKRKGLLWALGMALVVGPNNDIAIWQWLIGKLSTVHG